MFICVHMCVLGEGEYLFLDNRVTIEKNRQFISENASPKPSYTE